MPAEWVRLQQGARQRKKPLKTPSHIGDTSQEVHLCCRPERNHAALAPCSPITFQSARTLSILNRSGTFIREPAAVSSSYGCVPPTPVSAVSNITGTQDAQPASSVVSWPAAEYRRRQSARLPTLTPRFRQNAVVLPGLPSYSRTNRRRSPSVYRFNGRQSSRRHPSRLDAVADGLTFQMLPVLARAQRRPPKANSYQSNLDSH